MMDQMDQEQKNRMAIGEITNEIKRDCYEHGL